MSFGTIPLSSDDKPDGFVLLSMYKRLASENDKLRELVQYVCDEGYVDDWFVEKAAELGIEGHY